MGVSAGDRDEPQQRRKKRGSVNNASRLQGLKGAGQARGADWGACDPKWLAAVVVACTVLGGAVTFGTSRDGGAYSLTLMLDGDRAPLWFNGDADLDLEMEKVFAYLESLQ